MNGLLISFSVAVNGAQNFLTLVYFLCSVCMLLNSQMAEINGNYIFPKFKSDFFIILIFFLQRYGLRTRILQGNQLTHLTYRVSADLFFNYRSLMRGN